MTTHDPNPRAVLLRLDNLARRLPTDGLDDRTPPEPWTIRGALETAVEELRHWCIDHRRALDRTEPRATAAELRTTARRLDRIAADIARRPWRFRRHAAATRDQAEHLRTLIAAEGYRSPKP